MILRCSYLPLFFRLLLVLPSLAGGLGAGFCRAEEEPEVEPVEQPPIILPGGGVLRIQGQGRVQIQGGGMIQIQGGNLQINGANVQIQGGDAAGGAAAAENPPWLGIQMESKANLDLDEDEKAPPGVGVLDVIEKGPAAKAGLKAFDRVLKIDDKELKDEIDLRNTVRASKAGATLKVRVLRDNIELDIKVELEAMPAQANLGMFQGFNFSGNTKPGQVRFYNVPSAAVDSMGVDIITLRDGNRLEGNLLSLTATEATLRLQAGPEVVLDLAFVQSVRLQGGSRPKILPASVLLTDGSTLAGSELTYADEKFSLNLENQQQIAISRDHVSDAAVSPTEAPQFYRGPTANDGWKSFPSIAWTYADESWTKQNAQQGVLGRKFAELPPSLELEFDYLNPTVPDLDLTLFNLKLESRGNTSPGMVQVRWNQDTLTLSHFDGQQYFNLAPSQPAVKPEKLDPKQVQHFHLYADRLTGRLVIYRNEYLLGEYQLGVITREDLPRAGKVIHISGAGLPKISNLQVRPWAGLLPASKPVQQQASDLAAMAQAQAVEGTLATLTSTELSFAGNAPLPRQLPLTLRLKPSAVAKLPGGKIYVETKQGSSFAATAVKIVDKMLYAQTGFAGEVALPAINLRLLEFRDGVSTPANQSKLDVLTFEDGRQLTGAFAPPLANGKVPWIISAAKQPLLLDLGTVKSILLAPRTEAIAGPEQVVRLQNGDWFPAEIMAIDETSLTVKTAFTQSWKIPRALVETIYGPPTAKVVGDGASGRKRWKETSSAGGSVATFSDDETMPQQSYIYHDGGYRLRSSGRSDGNQAGLALPIPPEANDGTSIEFTLSGVDNWTMFSLMDARGESAFSIYASGDTIRATRLRGGGNFGNRRMEPFQFPIPKEFVGQGRDHRYQLVLDKANGSLHLGLNGQRLGTCKLKTDDAWTEITRLVFFPASYGRTSFKLSDLWITPWNGRLTKAVQPAPDQVALAFVNGDDAFGKLLSLNQAEAEVDTVAAGPLTLPLVRLRSIGFGGDPKFQASNYRVRLYDRGQLSGTDLAFNDQGATLTTAQGPVNLPLALLKEIVRLKSE